ncbi:MAG: pyridoxal phosphate-dependent aminotransferase, partial [Megasphaera micronuciformis]|nr:pyridoxal phosphate-dependent aminotransferase [Megasphaera micronuciformis]
MNWDNYVSANVRAIKPSGIRKFFDIANQIQGVLCLSIGEP